MCTALLAAVALIVALPDPTGRRARCFAGARGGLPRTPNNSAGTRLRVPETPPPWQAAQGKHSGGVLVYRRPPYSGATQTARTAHATIGMEMVAALAAGGDGSPPVAAITAT